MTDELRIWEDIEYFAMLKETAEHWCEFAVYELLWLDDDGRPVGNKAGSTSSPDPASSLEETQVYLHGSIKWDGCSNWLFDEQDSLPGCQSMLHFCGKQSAMNLGVLMERLYEWAAEVIEAWDAEIAE